MRQASSPNPRSDVMAIWEMSSLKDLPRWGLQVLSTESVDDLVTAAVAASSLFQVPDDQVRAWRIALAGSILFQHHLGHVVYNMQHIRGRSRTGCLVYRQRRKKCDEKRPRCAQCARLRLPCRWPDDLPQGLGNNLVLNPSDLEFSQQTVDLETRPVLGGLRIADHDGIIREIDEIPAGLVEGSTKPYASVESTSLHTRELRHTLIMGIFKGWNSVPHAIRCDDIWSRTILFDNQLQRCGQGLVARLASCFLAMSMHQYLANPDAKPEQQITQLPGWYLPNKKTSRRGPISGADFAPWPAVRQTYRTTPDKYINDRYMNILSCRGFRFVWPYSAASAITTSSDTSMLCLSDEFILRVNNLRSYTMAADFLCIYPEFRGDSPQLEPSPTYHRPESSEYLEALYWRILREKARQNLIHSGATARESAPDLVGGTEKEDSVDGTLGSRQLPVPRPRRRLIGSS